MRWVPQENFVLDCPATPSEVASHFTQLSTRFMGQSSKFTGTVLQDRFEITRTDSRASSGLPTAIGHIEPNGTATRLRVHIMSPGTSVGFWVTVLLFTLGLALLGVWSSISEARFNAFGLMLGVPFLMVAGMYLSTLLPFNPECTLLKNDIMEACGQLGRS
jgi:hypothetical protein